MDGMTLILGFLLSFLVAVVPTMLWAVFVWWCDRYEREPIPLALAAFFWGAVPAVIMALVFEMTLDVPAALFGSEVIGAVASSSAIAPVIEELAKGVALLLILLLWPGEFDDLLDGLLYGALIGFGFAMTENLLYFMGALLEGGWQAWGMTVLMRSVVFGLNHAFFTAFTGAGLGYARSISSRGARFAVPLLGLAAAIFFHAVHNLGATLTTENVPAILLSFFSAVSGVLLIAGMFWLALRQENRWLRTELADEVGGLLMAPEYDALGSLGGRRRMVADARRTGGGAGVRAARQFQRLATELAFCKYRLRGRGQDAALARRMAGLRAQLAALRTPPAGLA